MEKDFWVPLESNPASLSKFIKSLGVDAKWGFSDCYGLDEEVLAMTSQPVFAMILLFPYIDMVQKKVTETLELEKNKQKISPNVYYMKQLVGNACGTVAMVHCVANNMDKLNLADGFFKQFILKSKASSSEERGQMFGKNEELATLSETIATDTTTTQTEAPKATDSVDSHFICFTAVDGDIYELDGAKAGPINHGPTTSDTFLFDAAKVIKKSFVDKLEGNIMFSLMTLGPANDEEND